MFETAQKLAPGAPLARYCYLARMIKKQPLRVYDARVLGD